MSLPTRHEHHRFLNWAGTYSCKPESYYEPKCVDSLRNILLTAKQNGKKVKVVGCGHSPSDIACTNDVMISMKMMNRILKVDQETLEVKVQGGARVDYLNEEFASLGVTLPVQAAVSDITIAGAIATGTHGSSTQGGIMSTYVTSMTLMSAAGEIIECSRDNKREIFLAALCGLGAMGIMLDLTIRCDKAANYEEIRYGTDLQSALATLEEDSKNSQFLEYFYYPHVDKVQVVKISRTEKDVQHFSPTSSWIWNRLIGFHLLHVFLFISTFISALVPVINYIFYKCLFERRHSRVDRSDRVLNFECFFSQYVNEWSIPREKVGEALNSLITWVKKSGYRAHFPWELRFVRSDDIFLSPSNGGDRCYINIICYRPFGREYDHRDFWEVFESIMSSLGGRPHWAKKFSTSTEKIRAQYPDWDRFVAARKEIDPSELFSNPYLDRLFG